MSIATCIKDDLAAQLTSGRELPIQLTLESLAGHYNVSLTPVRTVVAELIDEGLLEKGPNRRLTATAHAVGEADRTNRSCQSRHVIRMKSSPAIWCNSV